MTPPAPPVLQTAHHPRAWLARALGRLDALANRLTTPRFNPLYQSGTLAVASFLAMLATGLYLLLFYRVGAPFASMERIEAQAWAGRWIRALHRYAADLAVASAALHALRMYAQGRSFGPRTLAWLSGLSLLALVYVCGWTGYVMVWDAHAQALAVEGARLLDALPIFSEPIGRTFSGESELPSAFFFLNLFLHIAVPIALALGLWIHVSRLARPVLLPPRGLLWGSLGALLAASVLVPAPLGPEARLDRLLGPIEIDAFYSFWLPLSRRLPAGVAWLVLGLGTLAVASAPWWTRPRPALRAPPSSSDEHLCTGCDQCTLDCPYDAIAMHPREAARGGHPGTLAAHPASPARHPERFARVEPELCVSCGICTGSCAPMAVGPPGRTGRDELARVRAMLQSRPPLAGDVVVAACACAAGRRAGAAELEGAPLLACSCVGNLHTSAIELLLRAGAGGVLVWSCPPRDCWFREGPRWLAARLDEGREAELRASIDRRRVRVVHAGEGEWRLVQRALAELRAERAALAPAPRETAIDLAEACDRSTGDPS